MTKDSSRHSADPDVIAILDSLFTRARAKDEFEYVCALLRIRGLEDAGWDPLEETQSLYRDLVGLMDGPLRDDTRLRLGLLLYCHLIEVDAIYGILENGRKVLLHLALGSRESYDAWLSFLHEMLARGLREPVLVISDGQPGLKRALKEVLPHVRRQRCRSTELTTKPGAQDEEHPGQGAQEHAEGYEAAGEAGVRGTHI